MGLSACTQEASYLKQLCKENDPTFVITEPIIIYEDNQGELQEEFVYPL